jgi:PEP-CTERM motif
MSKHIVFGGFANPFSWLPIAAICPRSCAFAAAISLALLATHEARADLVGTAVTGAYYYTLSSYGEYDTTFNQFDPANGYVPAGYGNFSSTTVTIGPEVEFALLDGGGTVADPGIVSITANFTGSGLTIQEIINYTAGLTGFQTVFTDPDFTGLNVQKTSDMFANGGFTTSLVGDTLTLSVGPGCFIGTGCTNWVSGATATWSFSGSIATPEPSTWAMMLLGLAGLGWVGYRGRIAARTARMPASSG